jgi:predicted molibdopterin-dependent oxidoreductase YjgC
MIVSPDCSNEGLYVAQKFVRKALGSNGIDSTAREGLGDNLHLWSRMFRRSISLAQIEDASTILAVGLDTRFNFSIVGVEIRKALQKGAQLVTVDARESNLSRYAELWLRPNVGTEGIVLNLVAKAIKGKPATSKQALKACGLTPETIQEAVEKLTGGSEMTVVLGPSIFCYEPQADLFAGLKSLMTVKGLNIVPLYTGTNTRGALELGAFSEILPGMAGIEDPSARETLAEAWGTSLPSGGRTTAAEVLSGARRPKVLYLLGSMPSFERPDCDYLIVQDLFEPAFPVELYLPAASFLESAATLVNVEGRVQDAPRLEDLPDSVLYGRARPDWWILSRLAQALGVDGFDYETDQDVLAEIAKVVRGFPKPGHFSRQRRAATKAKPLPEPKGSKRNGKPPKGNFRLVLQPGGYTHRGIDITSKVEGLQILKPEAGFHISPASAEALGIKEGDRIRVAAGQTHGSAPARIEPELPDGAVYLFVPEAVGGLEERDLAELYRLRPNPFPVEVTRDGV